jgi:putative membrane protein
MRLGFILRVLVVALGLWLASVLVPGIRVENGWTLLGAALLLGIVNALVRPLIVILTLPITILTLGLFLLVINAAMLGLVASFFEGFVISSFWSALLGAIIVSLTGWVVSWFIGPRGQVEVIVRRERF